MTDRKQRIDSITGQVEAMQAAVKELFPPAHVMLTDEDQPFWLSIIAEKAKVEWTAHDLELAALLTIAMRRLTQEEVKLASEDAVVTTTGGNLAANPRLRIVSDLHARVMKYRQTLGIHSRAKDGEARDAGRRRNQAKEAENAATGADEDDDLIARPTAH